MKDFTFGATFTATFLIVLYAMSIHLTSVMLMIIISTMVAFTMSVIASIIADQCLPAPAKNKRGATRIP